MDHREAFNKTLQIFKLKASVISEASGIPADRISKFRNGHNDIYSDTLKTLVDALPPDARAYYYFLLVGSGR